MTAIFRFYFLSTTLSTASCNLSDNIYDYYNVSQGKITIPSMDDGEEFTLTDVSFWDRFALVLKYQLNFFVYIHRPPVKYTAKEYKA